MAIASTFGMLVNAFTKSTKQGGVIFGGLLTVTGMVGMMISSPAVRRQRQFGIASLFTPQGWAARGMLITMSSAPLSDVIVNLLALLAMSIVFFAIGVWRFQKRYA